MLESKHVLQVCAAAVQKTRSNLREEWESYLSCNPDAHLQSMLPDLFSEIPATWTYQSSKLEACAALRYVHEKCPEVASELMSRLPNDLYYDPETYFGLERKWKYEKAPILELPDKYVLARTLRFLVRLKDYMTENPEVRLSDAKYYLLDRYHSKDAWRGVLYDERWKVEIPVDKIMEYAIRKIKPPELNEFTFRYKMTHELLLDWLDWSIYFEHNGFGYP